MKAIIGFITMLFGWIKSGITLNKEFHECNRIKSKWNIDDLGNKNNHKYSKIKEWNYIHFEEGAEIIIDISQYIHNLQDEKKE